MWKEIHPFSFSAGERKIMAHFVVETVFASLVAAPPRWVLRGENSSIANPKQPKKEAPTALGASRVPDLLVTMNGAIFSPSVSP